MEVEFETEVRPGQASARLGSEPDLIEIWSNFESFHMVRGLPHEHTAPETAINSSYMLSYLRNAFPTGCIIFFKVIKSGELETY